MCWVMPPVSFSAIFVFRIKSKRVVLPWSTWPKTTTMGGRGTKLNCLFLSFILLEAEGKDSYQVIQLTLNSFRLALWRSFRFAQTRATLRPSNPLANQAVGLLFYIYTCSGGDRIRTCKSFRTPVFKTGALPFCHPSKISPPGRTRTCNQLLKRQLLYQLSYGGLINNY